MIRLQPLAPAAVSRRSKWFLAGVLLTTVSACASASASVFDPSNSIYEGLNSVVVDEVLANPIAKRKITEEPAETQPSMAQGIVRNFEWCRSLHDAYVDWQRQGVRPPAPKLAEPTNPVNPSYEDFKRNYPEWTRLFKTGDIDSLRDGLTNESYCGVWIPATPGDVSGPTIAEVITRGT